MSFPTASPQTVPADSAWPGVRLWQRKCPVRRTVGKEERIWKQGRAMPHSFPNPSAAPLKNPSHTSQPSSPNSFLKPLSISLPFLATDTRFPCLSPLPHPDSLQPDYENCGSPSETSHPNHPAVLSLPPMPNWILPPLLGRLEVALSTMPSGECCGDERLLGQKFKMKSVLQSNQLCHCSCLCLNDDTYPSNSVTPGGGWYPSWVPISNLVAL